MNLQAIRSCFRRILRRVPLPSALDGKWGIRIFGYKTFVGGMWDAIGRLQFEFMKSEGLRPEHVLLDIGCGALRAGRFFIAYLGPGNYMGVDKEKTLIELGISSELPDAVLIEKKPQFIIAEGFQFAALSKAPDYAIAHSLFTHLSSRDIGVCLKNLRVHGGRCRLYATFFLGDSAGNPSTSHSLNPFFYSENEMRAFGEGNGWSFRYVGDWNHPRGQVMVEYRAD